MAVNIKDMIAKKKSKNSDKNLELKDINRDLIVSLLGISVYGKDARDEDILEIIIDGGEAREVERDEKLYNKIKDEYRELLKNKSIKKERKSGFMKNSEGLIVLTPNL